MVLGGCRAEGSHLLESDIPAKAADLALVQSCVCGVKSTHVDSGKANRQTHALSDKRIPKP